MKQYVLDQPPALAPVVPLTPPPGAASLPSPGRWRWLLLILLLEPLALAVLYLMLSGGSAESEAVAGPGVVAVASFPAPRPVEPSPAPREEPIGTVVGAASQSPVVEAASRVSHERGRYVVDLHSAPLGSALEMLSSATRARVTGGDIFAGSQLRLTRSAVAATPQEAWQAVFSEVASFAITCAVNACDVRFVSLTKRDGDASPTSRPVQGIAPGVAYPGAMISPPSVPRIAAPAWGAAAAEGADPTSSDN